MCRVRDYEVKQMDCGFQQDPRGKSLAHPSTSYPNCIRPAQKEGIFREEDLLDALSNLFSGLTTSTQRSRVGISFSSNTWWWGWFLSLLSWGSDQVRNADAHFSAFLFSGFRKNTSVPGRCTDPHLLSLTRDLQPIQSWALAWGFSGITSNKTDH